MAQDRGNPQEDRRGFHIEKSISLGHIITTVSIIVSVVWWASTVEKRIAVNETEIITLKTQAVTQREDLRDSLREIKDGLKELNSKLERQGSAPRRP